MLHLSNLVRALSRTFQSGLGWVTCTSSKLQLRLKVGLAGSLDWSSNDLLGAWHKKEQQQHPKLTELAHGVGDNVAGKRQAGPARRGRQAGL